MGVLQEAAHFLAASVNPNAPISDYVPEVAPEGTIFKEGYLMKRSRHG